MMGTLRPGGIGLKRGLVGLLVLVGSVIGSVWAQVALPHRDDGVSDAVMRQRILQVYPKGLPEVEHPWFNPPSAAKIALGNMLFFDPHLSRCGTVACASCHDPAYGYASPYQVPPGCGRARGAHRCMRRIRAIFSDGRN